MSEIPSRPAQAPAATQAAQLQSPSPEGGSLPASPNLEQLKKRAKELLRACREGDGGTLERVRPYFPDSNPMTLARAQTVIAREAGFSSWARLKSYIERIGAPTPPQRIFVTDIEYFEGRADGLLRTVGDGLPSSLEQIRRFHPDYAAATDSEITGAELTLDDAKLVLAREHGFETWAALKRHVAAAADGKQKEPFQMAYEAINRHDLAGLEAAIAADPSIVNAPGTNGNNLLGLAGSTSTLAVVRLLLEVGADVNSGNRYGWTVLHGAAYGNNRELAELVLAFGARLDLCARGEGGTPLMQALFWGHNAMADYLASHCLFYPNLRVAAGLGDLERLQSYFDGDWLTPEAGLYREYYRPHGGFLSWQRTDTPQEILDEAFVYAARNGRLEALEFLLAKGAGVRSEPYNGTPLHWAAAAHQFDAVDWLLEHGADVNQYSNYGGEKGMTPLHMPAWNGDLEMARHLVSRGADISLKDRTHNSPPEGWADYLGHPEVRDYLRSLRAES